VGVANDAASLGKTLNTVGGGFRDEYPKPTGGLCREDSE